MAEHDDDLDGGPADDDLDAEAAIQREQSQPGEPTAPQQKTCQERGCDRPASRGLYCGEHYELHKPGRKPGGGAGKRERAPRAATASPRKRGTTGAALRTKIKDVVMMTAAVAAVKDPRVYVAVEATVDEFAAAWANVADQSPSARKYIEAMLDGGVWATAVGATLVMVVTIAACTGNLPARFAPIGAFAVGRSGLTSASFAHLVPDQPPPQPGNANGDQAGAVGFHGPHHPPV